MEAILDNWPVLIAALAVLGCGGVAVWRFLSGPTEGQLQKVREWLLWAVTKAEKEFGGGTGQLKLRNVYDLFIQRFPWLVKLVSFDKFKGLVDEALEEMRGMLSKNHTIKDFVEGKEP